MQEQNSETARLNQNQQQNYSEHEQRPARQLSFSSLEMKQKSIGPTIFVSVLSSSLFGSLFYVFSSDKQYYGCENQQLVNWAFALGFIHLIYVGIGLLNLIILYLFKNDVLAAGIHSISFSIFGLMNLILVIALTVLDDNTCGDLHILNMVYYILFYIGVGLAILVTCCGVCLFGAAMAGGALAEQQKLQQLQQQLEQQQAQQNQQA